jgi:serine phosphatase RsbU (regulator of sigma subunit)/ligand-binding sensor domain-containing protein
MSRRIITTILVIALMLILASNLGAQRNYHFSKFNDLEKLTSTKVNDFLQDSYGFLWMATPDGLNRYDGRNMKLFKNRQGDENSLPDNECHVLLEDNERNIWVACFNQIGKLDRSKGKFKAYTMENLPGKNFVRFSSSLLDLDGNIWFTTTQHGVLVYDKANDAFKKVNLDSSGIGGSWGAVHDIVELKNGAIIAADYKNGLKKYNKDRNIFEDFHLKPGFSPSKIQVIYEDSKGNIWFAGDNLLIKYSPAQYMVVKYDLLKYSHLKSNYNQLTGVVEDNDGNMWISARGHGLFKLDQGSETARQFSHNKLSASSIKEDSVWKLFKDKYGIIWIGFQFGGINKLDTQIEPFLYTQLPTSEKEQNNTNIINQIIPSPVNRNEIILGTSTSGIYSFNLETNDPNDKFSNLYKIAKDSTTNITGLTVDNNGDIWFTEGNSWLKKLDYITKKITSFKSPHKGKTSFPYVNSSLNMSSTGNIWISSNHGTDEYNPVEDTLVAVSTIMNKKVDPKLKNFVSQIINDRTELASILKIGEGENLKKTFSLAEKQKILLTCVGEGRALGQMFDFGSLLSSEGNIIWAMDDLLQTYYSGGGFKNRVAFKCLDLEAGEYKLQFTSDIGHSYGDWNTLAPADSNWWGIQAFSVSEDEYSNIRKLNEAGINNNNFAPYEQGVSLELSKKYSNNIWIGSGSNGFFRYNISTQKYTQYNYDAVNRSSASNVVFCIYEDLDGIVWAGTYNSLIRLDPESGKLDIFTTEEGLPGGIIYSIIEDNNGALWINNSGGLSMLNKNAPIEKYVFINYDSRDGLTGHSQERTTAVWKNEDGRIFYGGKDGIISFLPGEINEIKPDVVIHDLKIKEISIFDDSSDVKIDGGILNAKSIILSYYQNDVAFDFSAIHFSRPEKNKIAYKLDGYNTSWINSDRNYASFTNLDPGEYTFKVKGANGDGIWNEAGKELKITISPPWWYTTYAYIGYGLIFIGLVFGTDRVQRRRLIAKSKERMKIQAAEHRAEAAELQARVVQAENERKSKELEEARQLQLSMLPKELPQLPNLDIAVYMQTATEVGGDYYDFHVGLDGTLTVVIGDATGHGMKAGTMVTTAKTLFKSYASNPDILFSFQEFTRCIKEMNMGKLSMCLTMLKIKGGKMQISTAGMPPSFIFRQDTKVVEEHLFKAMPLGTMLKFPYEVKDTTLKTGDTILLMSDGLPELQNDKEEMYGYKRIRNGFEDVAEKAPEEIISFLKNEGSAWNNNQTPDDDVTFVVIKVK